MFDLFLASPSRICVLVGNHDEALNYDGSRFASSVSQGDFTDFLNANIDREAGPGPWDREPPAGLGGGGPPAGSDPLHIFLGQLAAAARARTKRTESSSFEEVAPMRRRGGGCADRIFILILFLTGC